MKNFRLIVTIVIISLIVTACVGTKIGQPVTDAKQTHEKLPVDPRVKIGKLDNGLTYYIRNNEKPENRLHLNLVVNAGAVDEDENQRGLAHLCEHMAFNGTKHFQKQELIDYLESIGMRFGADLNAYTSFDETVYMLQLPTENDTILEKGFQVLDDWASNVSYDHEEIDKERGVVHEEWRLGRGAGQRVRDEFLPVLFHGSKYANRLPIGLMDVVDNCSYETLKRFYKDWYRPDLMAVVAVGDLDVEKTEALIKKYFQDNKNPEDPRPKETFPLPDHEDTKYVIATDEELSRTTVYTYIKHDTQDQSTLDWYRNNMITTLFTRMLNARYQELIQQADPPFVAAFTGQSNIVRTKDFFSFAAIVNDDGIKRGLKTLQTEIKRVEEHGFLQNELERTKKQILRSFESAYNEREKTDSDYYVSEYTRNFLTQEPIPGIEWSWEHVQKILPEITVEEVNQWAKKLVTDDNRVVIVTGPEKEGLKYPSKEELAAITEEVKSMDVAPYQEDLADTPLLSDIPNPGEVVAVKKHEAVDITELELSNGIKVYYKVTDFKDDEIAMSSFSPGGHSLATDDEYISASYAARIIDMSGVGDFDNIQLKKKLAGKRVSSRPFISELREGITGTSAKEDLETMFKLTHLYFIQPRKDETTFKSMLSRQIAMLKNRQADPQAALQDTLTKVLTQNHYRSRPMTPERLESELKLNEAYQFYKDRFADADDFTFFFVGNIDPQQLTEYCKRYLGSLPSLPREDKWRDIGEDYPTGKIEKTIHAGMDEKSTVVLVYNGEEEWSMANAKKVSATKDILNIMLRKKIREEESGTYGVRCMATLDRYPDNEYQFFIYFGCDPQRADALTGYIIDEIEKLKTEGPSQENLEKVKATSMRSYEKRLENNRYWLGRMNTYVYHGLDVADIPHEQDLVDQLTKEDIQQAAQQYFGKNRVKIIQLPEK
ncbi:MAG: M16 family metallopeptidase [Fidelibacterota bacterium]